ncbi:beta-mannosidase [Paenibacillus sp. FSL H8-0034]|uniref:beta-mannosidase n=1 Tax=Paenibacillus sp. FSL H8-0034 TaxID=2954671 RepID=UPI0030F8AC90
MTKQQSVELSGEWKVASYPKNESSQDKCPDLTDLEWIEASVPGAVHYDLMKVGKLTNPFESSAAAHEAAWVAQTDWIYHNEFSVDKASTASSRTVLQFAGIDTYADIWLNGNFIGATANAYRAYEFEINNEYLQAGDNVLIVHVKNHYRMIEPKVEEAKRMGREGEASGLLGKSLIRRYQRNFYAGSSLLNLGTGVLGIGIYKPVQILVYPGAYMEGSHFAIQSLSAEQANVSVAIDINRGRHEDVELRVEAIIWETDVSNPAAVQAMATKESSIQLPLSISQPKLWWPHGYGNPHLYNLTLHIYEGDTLLHSIEKRVGLKQVELIQKRDNGRKTFFIKVNGRKVHARGSNLIPVDYIKVHDTWDVYDRLFKIIKNGYTNMIRIWGGGAMEQQQFYDTCDESGIMIWQDFFLHSNVYPDYDSEFVEEFTQESIEILKQIRDRASLTILCGGNEQQEGWDEWNWKVHMDQFYGEKLIKELLPEVAAAYCPEIPYVNNSPHGGKWAQSPIEGDMHCWGNFYNAFKDPQFVTESCWNLESYSRPETLKESMGLDVEEYNYIGWHKKWNEVTGLTLMNRFPHSNYFSVNTLKDYLHSLEIEHARADYNAFSVLRLRSSSCSGILYWSLNKGGPLFGFGCVDYKGYPLMSYYTMKRLYADVVVGIYRDIDDIKVVASNLTNDTIEGELRVLHLDTDGTVIKQFTQPVSIASDFTGRMLDIEAYYDNIVDRTKEILQAQLVVDGEIVSEDTLYFCPYSEFEIAAKPIMATIIKVDPESWTLEIEASSVSKMIEIEGNKKWLFSDNYFSLIPGVKRQIQVTLLENTNDEEPRLTVSSLDDPSKQLITLHLG